MRIEKAVFTRKYNLGNYESLDLSLESSLGDKDNPQEVWSVLQDQADVWFANRNRKKSEEPIMPEEKPQEKKYFNADALIWKFMPPTDKGPWESTESSDKSEYREIVDALEAADKPLFSKDALYWLLKKEDKVTGIGRRKKK